MTYITIQTCLIISYLPSSTQKAPPLLKEAGLFVLNSRRRPTLPHSYPCSTIGPEGLNFRVRDGNGCDPLGIATEKLCATSSSGLLLCCARLEPLNVPSRTPRVSLLAHLASGSLYCVAYLRQAWAPCICIHTLCRLSISSNCIFRFVVD